VRIIGAEPGDDEHRQPREAAPELANDLLPGQIAMEAQVHDGQVDAHHPDMMGGFCFGSGVQDAEPLGAEDVLDEEPEQRFILHHQREWGVRLIHGAQAQ
jgi:hypothetical protein